MTATQGSATPLEPKFRSPHVVTSTSRDRRVGWEAGPGRHVTKLLYRCLRRHRTSAASEADFWPSPLVSPRALAARGLEQMSAPSTDSRLSGNLSTSGMLRERSNTVRFQLPGVSNESKADQAQVEAAINRARRTSVAPPKPMTGCGNRKTSGIGGPRMAPAHAPAGVKRGSLFRLGSSKGRGSLAFANQIAAGA